MTPATQTGEVQAALRGVQGHPAEVYLFLDDDGGSGLIPPGVYHLELQTTLPNRDEPRVLDSGFRAVVRGG